MSLSKLFEQPSMFKFPFLYVGLGKTMKDIFKLVVEKKCCLEKTRENHPRISNCMTNQYPDSKQRFFSIFVVKKLLKQIEKLREKRY